MSRKKSLLHEELDKRISKAEDRRKQRYVVEDECAQTEMTEGHLESFGNRRSLRRGRKKSNFQIELDRLMSEAEDEQSLISQCETADHIDTNSLSMTKGFNLSVDGAELSCMYACIIP